MAGIWLWGAFWRSLDDGCQDRYHGDHRSTHCLQIRGMENRHRGGPRPGAASVGHGPWVGDTGAHVQSLTGHLSNQLRTQGPRKVTFAALQTRLVHTRATRIAPTPDGRLRVSARARTADPVCSSVCLALSLSGLILSAVQRSRLGCRRSQQKSACSAWPED